MRTIATVGHEDRFGLGRINEDFVLCLLCIGKMKIICFSDSLRKSTSFRFISILTHYQET